MSASNKSTACHLNITLVHGTWPRGGLRDVFLTLFYGVWPSGLWPKGLWFAENSEFRARLSTALATRGLSAQISPFLWSGANSVAERDEAARQLCEDLRAETSVYPNSVQVLIAHSHGGNVVFRALHKLDDTCAETFITTIAAPFVEILPAKLTFAEEFRTALIFFGVAIIIPTIIVEHLIVRALSISSRTEDLLVLPIFATLTLLSFFHFKRRSMRNTAKRDKLVALTSLSPSVRKHPLLVLRALDDEASLALAAAAIGNRLSGLIGRLSYWANGVVGLAVGALVAILLSGEYFGLRFSHFSAQDLFRFYWKWFLIPMNFTIFVGGWLLAPGLFKCAYGREFLFNSQSCDINAQSAPDSLDRQFDFEGASTSIPASWGTAITLHDTVGVRRRLRHGLYDHPLCAERIAAWLNSELARRGSV
jgi:hypothetical protein